MKAIIMAGGDGSRLRPITCTIPKPMVRVLDVPVMEYAVDLLRRHGVRDIGVTLRYLPDVIRDYFGDGSRFGVRITYFTEASALGTAGGVKQAQEFLTEPFFVLSGDGITDCDLTVVRHFHQISGAEATLVTVRVPDPREYGLVCTDSDGRITRFAEKPDWPDVVCDRANTGIYMLEPSVLQRIPSGEFCDFSRHVFPAMLKDGAQLFAHEADCYWCDIGDTAALIRANHDALQGRLSSAPIPPDGRCIHPSARIDPRAVIHPPVSIGAGVHICAGAAIGPEAVIGAHCRVESRASVRRSVLMDGVHIAADAQLRGAFIASNARILPGAQVYENAVVGDGCSVGAGAQIAAGVRVWPEKTVPERMHLRENIAWGHAAQAAFHAGTVDCFTPSQAVQCAQAMCAALDAGIVLIAHSGHAAAAAQHRAVCAGLMAQGAQLYDCHAATLPELRCAIRHIGADCACYVTDTAFYPLTALGANLTGADKRHFLACLNRGEIPPPYTGPTHLPQSAGRCDLIYLRHTVPELLTRALTGFPHPVALYAPGEPLLTLAERAFLRAGLDVRAEWEADMMDLAPQEIGIHLSETGESARFFTVSGEMSEAEIQLLTARALLDMGEKRLLLPDDATPAIEKLADSLHAQAERIPGGAAQWADQLSHMAPDQLTLHFDGIAAALRILAMLNRLHMSPDDFRRSMPAAVRQRAHVDIPFPHRAHALQRLNNMLRPDTPGRYHFVRGQDHAWILPDEDEPRLTVLAEAADAETATELCAFYEQILRQAVSSES